ncbi:MAG: hypothetical protein JSR46_09330, partial [Verrucomicrobia bacterium]|nr:hypothetical protein [Verrucomicrobiota bacterium]
MQNSMQVSMQVEQKSPREELSITEGLAALTISNNQPRRELVRTATVMVNRKYQETVNSNNETQEQLQIIMKKSRWVCSIPIVIITKVIEIYNRLLQAGDEVNIDLQLQQAQHEYDDSLPITFNEFKGYQEDVLPIREAEYDAVCKVKFKSFINKVVVDPGIATFETLISKLRAEQYELTEGAVTENDKTINEVRLQTIEKQLMTLQEIRGLSLKFLKEISEAKESNPHYKEYKDYFNSTWYGGALKAAKKVPDEVIDKAKRVCTLYFQFYPKIICDCGEFRKKIDLEFLEACDVDSLYRHDMICERERNSAVFESIISELKHEESGFYAQYNGLDELAGKFSNISEGHLKTLNDIDGYNEEREKRLNLGEHSY